MENSLQIQQIELFLEEVIIRELGKMQEIEISYMPFVLMGQAIEVLGGFLDNKPMKAKGQSLSAFTVFRRKISFNSRRVLSGYLSGLPAFGESFEGRPDKTEKYSI